jgi:uncharacterized membrane protein required for colicin V production
MVRQLVTLAGVVAGYIVAVKLYEPAAKLLPGIYPGTAKVISFIALFVACIIASWIIGWILEKVLKISGLGLMNRIGGGMLGFLKAYVIVSVVVMILMVFLPTGTGSGLFKNSLTLKYILPGVNVIKNVIPLDIRTKGQQTGTLVQREIMVRREA